MIVLSFARRRGLAAAAAAVLAATLLPAGAAPARAATGPVRTVIVELTATPTIAAAPAPGTVDAQAGDRVRRARLAVVSAERGVTEAARRAGIALTVRRSYQVLLPGMAVRVAADQVPALRRLPGVKAVHEVARFRVRTTDSVPLIGAPQVWQRRDAAGNPARGTGVTVAVIDTGVDYTHPALGGGFGPGRKVVAGHDFANDDDDPMDDNGHGTHVAGIVAGSGQGGAKAVTGVAPDATLTAYKVLSADGYGETDDVVAAIEAAVDPANPYRADVINMSLGGPGDGTDPVGLAATRASRAGVVVVAAAGNEGPGERTIGSPAAADGVLAVGASTSGLRLPVADLASPRRERVQTYRSAISANPPARPVTADVVDLGAGTPADYDRAGDLRGKIALVTWPPYPGQSLADVDRFREAERRGLLAVIGYTPGIVAPAAGQFAATPAKTLGASDDLRFDRLVVLGIEDPGQYQQIRSLLDAGPVRMTITSEDATDQIASFSSRGPDPHWRLKPEIVAPGVEIRSSVPSWMWEPGVLRFSGTSMAAPHVAGAAALLRQLWPNAAASRITGALIGSAKAVPDAGAQVAGAGRLDVAAALSAGVTADPPALSFGLADLSRGWVSSTRTLTLRNDETRAARVRLGSRASDGSPGRALVTPREVTVPANGTARVTVRIISPAPAEGQASADVSGWVTVDAPAGRADLRVPYLLAVRAPDLYVSPEPSDGRSELFLNTVVPASAPPTVVVRSPRGRQVTVAPRHDHDLWWRAPVTGDVPGVYTVTATVPTVAGPTIVGRTTFEVADPSAPSRWDLVGPHATGGQLATTAADPNRLVATSPYTAGLWLTTDRARTWQYRRLSAVSAGAPTVLIDPKRADRMWVAVNAEGEPTYQGKVLRTDDAGRTWRTLPLPDTRIDAFAQQESGGVLAAVTADAVWTSRDGGDTWTSAAAPWTGGVMSIAFAGSDLYAAAGDGVWRWPGLSGTPVRVRPADDFSVTPRAVVVAGDMVAVAQWDATVWGSTDAGRSWRELLKADSLFALSGAGDTLLADGYRQTFLSRDRGRTWTSMTEPLDAITVDVAQWPGDGKTLLLGMENTGVYSTTDTKNYSRIGVPGQSAEKMVTTAGKLFVGTPADLYSTPLPADPTRPEWGNSGGEGRVGQSVRGLAVAPDNPRVIWKLLLNGWAGTRLMRSTDGGATFTQVIMSDVTALGLAVHPADPRQVFIPYFDLGGAGLFVTRDGGASWKRINHQTRYSAVAGDPADPRRLWLGDANGLWRSDDGGATRVKVLDGPVTALHLDGRRIVAGGDRLRVSTDGGKHFTTARSLAPGRNGLQMRVSQIVAVGGMLYAGTTAHVRAGLPQGGRGVLRSTDGGRTWLAIGAGLPDPSVRSLAASPDGHWLFAGTGSGGVYRLDIRR